MPERRDAKLLEVLRCQVRQDRFVYLVLAGTIHRWFATWRDDGRFERINHALVMADRERVGGDASPSAAIMDSQSIKTTEARGLRGYDAAKSHARRSSR